jgi:hypothetical protein
MIRIAFFFVPSVCCGRRLQKNIPCWPCYKQDEYSSTSGANLMTTKRWMLLGCAMISVAAVAADMYRWVDENGRVSISDTVPAAYRDVATKIDTSASDISDSQRQKALERADQERQRVQAGMDAAKTAKPQSAPIKAAEIKPPRSNSETDCEALIRAYRESQECFEPFKLRATDGTLREDGAVREEAFQYCTSLPSPFNQCALPSY